jgi:hypothetical protein
MPTGIDAYGRNHETTNDVTLRRETHGMTVTSITVAMGCCRHRGATRSDLTSMRGDYSPGVQGYPSRPDVRGGLWYQKTENIPKGGSA